MAFNICIVGLGLMGASLAQALRGFEAAQLIGVDSSDDVLQKARRENMVDIATASICEGVRRADLVLFCVYARHLPGLLAQCLPSLKPGAVLADICGVKTALYQTILPMLPEHVAHVGLHPMAGRERDGIDNATGALYHGSSMLICPTPATTPAAEQLAARLARHIGCARIHTVACDAHDAIIAYTSDLMHISAAALCIHSPPGMDLAFTAGAYRDCTRVADINADAWADLLLENRVNVQNTLSQYIEDLQQILAAIADGDRPALRTLLACAGDNKREVLKR